MSSLRDFYIVVFLFTTDQNPLLLQTGRPYGTFLLMFSFLQKIEIRCYKMGRSYGISLLAFFFFTTDWNPLLQNGSSLLDFFIDVFFLQRIKIHCYKMGRPYGTFLLTIFPFTTDWNPLLRNYRLLFYLSNRSGRPITPLNRISFFVRVRDRAKLPK